VAQGQALPWNDRDYVWHKKREVAIPSPKAATSQYAAQVRLDDHHPTPDGPGRSVCRVPRDAARADGV